MRSESRPPARLARKAKGPRSGSYSEWGSSSSSTSGCGGIIDPKTGADPILSKLATGKLELEVRSDPPAGTGKEAPKKDT